eukprot:g3415.t1
MIKNSVSEGLQPHEHRFRANSYQNHAHDIQFLSAWVGEVLHGTAAAAAARGEGAAESAGAVECGPGPALVGTEADVKLAAARSAAQHAALAQAVFTDQQRFDAAMTECIRQVDVFDGRLARVAFTALGNHRRLFCALMNKIKRLALLERRVHERLRLIAVGHATRHAAVRQKLEQLRQRSDELALMLQTADIKLHKAKAAIDAASAKQDVVRSQVRHFIQHGGRLAPGAVRPRVTSDELIARDNPSSRLASAAAAFGPVIGCHTAKLIEQLVALDVARAGKVAATKDLWDIFGQLERGWDYEKRRLRQKTISQHRLVDVYIPTSDQVAPGEERDADQEPKAGQRATVHQDRVQQHGPALDDVAGSAQLTSVPLEMRAWMVTAAGQEEPRHPMDELQLQRMVLRVYAGK